MELKKIVVDSKNCQIFNPFFLIDKNRIKREFALF